MSTRLGEKPPGKALKSLAAREGEEITCRFELEESPIRVRYLEFNGRLECYQPSVRQDALPERDRKL